MISIIVPVYNGEKYIKNCADALISQSYKDIEIIFINDGSKDNSGNILDTISKQDSRVKVIHKENGGVSSARNRGLKEAIGEYIMFCDVDDVPNCRWCEELLFCAEKFPDRLPICAAQEVAINDTSKIFLYTLQKRKCIETYTLLAKQDLLTIEETGLLVTLWNKIFSAKIIKTNSIFFNETISNAEDNLFVYEYLTHTHGNTVFLNETLYSYIQQNPTSLSKQSPYDKILTGEIAFAAQKALFEKLQFSDPTQKELFYKFHLNNFLLHLSNVINNSNDSRKERLYKSNSALNLPGFKECLFSVNPKFYNQGKLIKIYRSKILRWLYNVKLIYNNHSVI